MSRNNIQKAASDLEDLLGTARLIVNDMRKDSLGQADHEYAYARIYWLRWRLSTIINDTGLGVGVPRYLPYVKDFYIQDNRERQ